MIIWRLFAVAETHCSLINDILDFSKIEGGKMELECQPFDLRECIEGSLDLVAANAKERSGGRVHL